MRRIIFILMIALIPLRGWMGEAMATGMAVQSVVEAKSANAINIIAPQAMNTLDVSSFYTNNSQMMPDCAMHLASSTDSTASTDYTTKHICEHCQACHSTALVGELPQLASASVANSAPIAPATRYASASLAFGQKPPIL